MGIHDQSTNLHFEYKNIKHTTKYKFRSHFIILLAIWSRIRNYTKFMLKTLETAKYIEKWTNLTFLLQQVLLETKFYIKNYFFCVLVLRIYCYVCVRVFFAYIILSYLILSTMQLGITRLGYLDTSIELLHSECQIMTLSVKYKNFVV